MPVFTVYTQVPKPKGRFKFVIKTVHRVYEDIVSWQHLKSVLLQAMRNIYRDYDHQTEAVLTVVRHLPGKYKREWTSYRTSRTHLGLQPMFRACVLYLHNSDEIKVERAVFIDPSFLNFRVEYRREKGLKWKPPPLVPPGFYKMLHDPKSLTRDLNTVKSRSYAVSPQNIYASAAVQRHEASRYAGQRQGYYGCGRQVFDRDKYEEGTEH